MGKRLNAGMERIVLANHIAANVLGMEESGSGIKLIDWNAFVGAHKARSLSPVVQLILVEELA